MGGNTQPLVVGSLIDGLQMSKAAAGLLSSIELCGVAAASFVLAPRMGTLPRRKLIFLGAIIAAIGYFASTVLDSFGGLAICRVLAGIGAGMVLAIGNGSASASYDPERVFALMTILSTLAIAIVLQILPGPIGWLSYRGAYLGIGIATLVFAPALTWTPQATVATHLRLDRGIPNFGLGIATMASNALFVFNQTSTWAFTERIALAAHLTHAQVGLTLSGATLSGLIGAGLATWIGIRFGRVLPLVVGILVNGATILGTTYSHVPTTYAVFIVVANIAYFGIVPYALGTAASLDRQGRWAAAATGAATVGAAIGPGVGGPIVELSGFTTLGWLVMITSLLSVAAIVPVALTLDRRDSEQAASPPDSSLPRAAGESRP